MINNGMINNGAQVKQDLSPQLGGNLDLNGFDITGTGDILADNERLNAKAQRAGVYFDDEGNAYAFRDGTPFHFGDGSNDQAFGSGVWVKLYEENNKICGVFGTSNATREWSFGTRPDGLLYLRLNDSSADAAPECISDDALSLNEWLFVAFYYDGRGGADAANGITMYLNGKPLNITANNDASYVAMENTGQDFWMGRASNTYGSADISGLTPFNRVLDATENQGLYDRGGVPAPEDRWATEGTLTSGTLTVGQKYRINNYVTGDDFTNVGASSNATGEEFVATGTTPTTWSNGSELENIGALAHWSMDKGIGSQPLDASPNKYHLTLSGDYTHLLKERQCQIEVEVANDTGSATNTNLLGGSVQPANTFISGIAFRRTTGSGSFQIGTASAGTEIIGATSDASGYLDASQLTSVNLVTAVDDLFINEGANTTHKFTIFFKEIM